MNELSDFLSEFEESGGSEVRMMRLKCDGDGRLCWQADRQTGRQQSRLAGYFVSCLQMQNIIQNVGMKDDRFVA